jgi:polyisoprenoid-binding protein YceI
MKNKTIWLLPFVVTAMACPNPADKAPKAEVTPKSAATQPATVPATPPTNAPSSKVAVPLTPENTTVAFVGSKVTGKHEGGFKTVTGTLEVDPTTLTASTLTIDVDMSSVFTDEPKLTGHLKSNEFFDVEKFPKAAFRVTKIAAGVDEAMKAKSAGSTHTLTGELMLHGVTKAISFPATIALAEGQLKATSEFALNRKDFGIVYPGKPDDLIRDDVLIKLSVNAAVAKPEAAETKAPASPEQKG